MKSKTSSKAPPATIELECPSCQQLLEIDSGFAGGVCRCSYCGTLMTVPADPSRERAESLVRPERPDTPGGIPSPARPPAPVDLTPPPQSPRAATTPTPPSRPATPPTPPALPTSAAAPGTQVYTTASGKTITVKAAAIPTARKRRKAVRATTIAIVVGFLAILAAFTAYAVNAMLSEASRSDPAYIAREVHGGYDPDVNPFLLDRPNFLGLSLQNRAMIALDASSSSRGWLSLAQEAVLVGILDKAASSQVQLAFWTETAPRLFPQEPKKLAKPDRAALVQFMDETSTVGVANPLPVVEKAIVAKVDQLIFVTSQALPPERIAALAAALKKASLQVDIVLISQEDPDLESLAKAHDGRYVTLPRQRLTTWYRDAQDAKPQ